MSGSYAPRLAVVGARGWFGSTLVHEYLRVHGVGAAGRLLLLGSRNSDLALCEPFDGLRLRVLPLSTLRSTELADFDALIWYAFVLQNQLGRIGSTAYRETNDAIATEVFQALSRRSDLRCVFASSGAALQHDVLPSYEDDPYAHLKISYERRLRSCVEASVLYPYAVTGRYLQHPDSFALGSFIGQALTGRPVEVTAPGSVIRSYGSATDLSRFVLAALSAGSLPPSLAPVSHTLSLVQLAWEVVDALGSTAGVVVGAQTAVISDYSTNDLTFPHLMSGLGLSAQSLRSQILETAAARAFD